MKLFIVFISGLVLFAACKKKENDNLSAKAKLLVAGKWQMSAGTSTTNYMGKDTTIDIYASMNECDKDDFVLFASNGTGTIDESANKCATDQQVEGFSWALLENDTKLALVDSNPDTMTLVELTNAQLKFSLTRPNTSGEPVTTVWTFKNIK